MPPNCAILVTIETFGNQSFKSSLRETLGRSDVYTFSSSSPQGIADQFDVFGCGPTIKFSLSWCSEAASGGMVERPRPLMPRDNSQDIVSIRSRERKSNRSSSVGAVNGRQKQIKPVEKPPRIVYQFLIDNDQPSSGPRQQTEAKEDLHCPWCALNCMELYALLKHLKLSHPRFLFTYVVRNSSRCFFPASTALNPISRERSSAL